MVADFLADLVSSVHACACTMGAVERSRIRSRAEVWSDEFRAVLCTLQIARVDVHDVLSVFAHSGLDALCVCDSAAWAQYRTLRLCISK